MVMRLPFQLEGAKGKVHVVQPAHWPPRVWRPSPKSLTRERIHQVTLVQTTRPLGDPAEEVFGGGEVIPPGKSQTNWRLRWSEDCMAKKYSIKAWLPFKI